MAPSRRLSNWAATVLATGLVAFVVLFVLHYESPMYHQALGRAMIEQTKGSSDPYFEDGFHFTPTLVDNKTVQDINYYVRFDIGNGTKDWGDCFYRLTKVTPPLAYFGKTGWYFELRDGEWNVLGATYKTPINWNKPPRLYGNPTPRQLWRFVNQYVDNVWPGCNPDATEKERSARAYGPAFSCTYPILCDATLRAGQP